MNKQIESILDILKANTELREQFKGQELSLVIMLVTSLVGAASLQREIIANNTKVIDKLSRQVNELEEKLEKLEQ